MPDLRRFSHEGSGEGRYPDRHLPELQRVWLDRGELDKLMANVREERPKYNEWYYGDSDEHRAPKGHQPSGQHYPPPKQHYSEYDKHGHSSYPNKKKKKSVLDVFGDLFD
ncbi:hypothetical protein CM49_04898 [Paenibacillus sp. P1XP2]|nr:hypothetical protein CM49_04898 [Paenibacillus sp. P1XP2]